MTHFTLNYFPGFDNILNWLRLQPTASLFLLLMMSSSFHHQHCSSNAAVAVWDFVWTVFYTFFTLNSPREHEKSIWANEFLTIVSFSVAGCSIAEGSSKSNITIAATFQRLVYTTGIIIKHFFLHHKSIYVVKKLPLFKIFKFFSSLVPAPSMRMKRRGMDDDLQWYSNLSPKF